MRLSSCGRNSTATGMRPVRRRSRFTSTSATAAAPRHQLPPLPALPPANLRQGRTLPPNPQKVAHPPTPNPDTGPTTDPARQLPPLLQHHPATPCTTPPHPTTDLPRPTQGTTHRHPANRRLLPHPP